MGIQASVHLRRAQHSQLVQGRCPVARVGCDGQAAFQMNAGGGLHQLAVDFAEGAGIDADLDDARPDARAL